MTAVATFNPTDHPRDQYGQFRETQSLALSGTPKSFSGLDESEEWGSKAFGDWGSSLSPEQKQGLVDYTNQDYVPINNFLRGKGTETGAAARAKALTETLRSSEIPEDITVHRMLSDDAMVDAMFGLELEGGEFRDEGFVSTTMDPDMLGELDLEKGEFPIFAEINIPKGARGASVAAAGVGYPEEQELLLPPGNTFKVTKATLNADNTISVTMDLIEQDV